MNPNQNTSENENPSPPDAAEASAAIGFAAIAKATVGQAVTVGRMVHYRESAGSEPVAAVVTRVWSPDTENTLLNLVIFVDGIGTQPRTSIPPLAHNSWGWSWPPRA